MVVEITTRIGCPNACKYCPQDKLVSAYGGEEMMSFETFKTCVDKLGRDTTLAFTGMCEPFVNPLAIDMLEYWKGKKYISTTLVGLEEVGRLNKIKFTNFFLHLPSEIDNFPFNFNAFFKLKQPFKAHFHGKNVREDVPLSGRNAPIGNRAGNLGFKEKTYSGKGCKREKQPVLLPDGRVLLCCMDYGMEYVIGNLLEQSFKDIINSNIFKKEKAICKRCQKSL